MLKFNGLAMPTPSDLDLKYMPIEKQARTASGKLVVDVTAIKKQLNLKWNYLSKDNLSLILIYSENGFITVEYVDPRDSTPQTGTFKADDKSINFMSYVNSIARYKDVSMLLIEV